MKALLYLSVLLCATGQVWSDDSYAKADQALRKTLFADYNKNSLPDKTTIINVTGLVITNFKLDELHHTMEMQAWLKESWNDPRFEWDPSTNNDIQYLAVDPNSIWMPDFEMYNGASAKDSMRQPEVKALAYPSNKVLFVPPIDFRFQCLLDLTYWPHDVHNCSLKVGSWVHSAYVLDINLDEFDLEVLPTGEISPNTVNPNNVSHSDFTITDWSAERFSKYYSCCDVPYVSFIVSMIVARNGQAYNWTVKLPSVCLCLLTLVLFLMPPGAGEKVVFGGICLILDVLFLNYITGQVGQAPTHTPLIVQLLGQQIVLVLASILVSAIVVRMARAPHSYGLPSYIKRSATGLARVLCLGNYVDPKSSKIDEVENGTVKSPVPHKPQTTTPTPCEWLMLSAVVDRLALIVYLSICFISLIRFTIVM